MSRSRLAPTAAISALLACLAVPSSPARADEPAPPAVPPWVTILTVEHARGNPKALEPFLAPDADRETRRHAIVALGRIGARAGVADLLRQLLARGGEDLPLVLEAVALTRDPDLALAVLPVLDRKSPEELPALRAAVECLGYLGDPPSAGAVAAFLSHADPGLRGAAAMALGRLKAEERFDAVLPLLSDSDPRVGSDAACAAWRLAAARKAAATKKDAKWDGDLPLAETLLGGMLTFQAEHNRFLVRAASLLLPKEPVRPAGTPVEGGTRLPNWTLLFPTSGHASPWLFLDPADTVSRVYRGRTGAMVLASLDLAGEHEDPLVRETVADVCGENGSREALDVLLRMLSRERDARVREALAVAFARCAHQDLPRAALRLGARPPAPVARALTDARILLGPKSEDALARAAALARDPKTSDRVRWEVLSGFEEKDGPLGLALAREFLSATDPVVRESAVSLAGKKGGAAVVAELVAAYGASPGRAYQDARIAAVKALAAAGGPWMQALDDPSPFVRLAAREAMATLPEARRAAVPEDPRPNDWKGLPRPKKPLLGLDLTKGDPWLSEEEILRLAEAMVHASPRFVVSTDVGDFTLEVDATRAPVHAVNLLLCAEAGVYDGTPWHRVVPAFVIQGGDPRGDGSGDAGYSVPDEITDLPFVRGALGMPKNTKDTGGCQLFVMHCAYPPLDRNYTCYGRVISGLDVVDRLRVGDRIRTVRPRLPR